MALTPGKVESIVGMFVRGYGIDSISEQGVYQGWTRDDVKAVVAMKEWALDWDGRLQQRYLSRERIPEITASRLGIAEADVERMVAVGTDHEVGDIRRLAAKAQRGIDELRRALIIQEEKDAEEVARRRRERAAADAERLDPTRREHGTWGTYLWEKINNLDVCPACALAGASYHEMGQGRKREVAS
jgi:hypothetical protein